MNKIMKFDNPEFGSVRTVCIDGEPWLVGKDVALILKYSNPQKAIRDHVDIEAGDSGFFLCTKEDTQMTISKTNEKKSKSFFRKLGAGLMAGLCAVSMIGTSIGGTVTANAASVSTTENSAFPSADTVIAKAAELLGSPYGWGFKGYTGVYYQGSYSPLSLDFVRNQGVDCSGLIYYTLTHLGYKTSGFSWNNPVPVDAMHWLTVSDNCTISYGGVTSKIDVEKKNVKSTEHP